jgi:hypothetical protein
MKGIKIAILPIAVVIVLAAIVLWMMASGREYEAFVEEHGHHHVAPHGGTLIMLGDHTAHIELVLEPDSGHLTAYLLDGHAEHPVRIADETLAFDVQLEGSEAWRPVTLEAVASSLTGETVGDTSAFEATVSELVGVEAFGVKTPAFTIRGVEMPGLETRFPEGNE